MVQVGMSRSRRAEAMPGAAAKGKVSMWFAAFVGGPMIGISLSQLMTLFIHTTPVRPYHLETAGISLLLALGMAVTGTIVVFAEKRLELWKRIGLALFAFAVGFIAVFLIVAQLLTSVDEALDFPAGKTVSSTAVLPITEAYQTHGKHSGEYIRTAYGRFHIDSSDYSRMKSQRPAGLIDPAYDRIAINGYYCAQLPIQTAGKAARVMLGTEDYLPSQSIELCPTTQGLPFATPAAQ